MIGVVLVLGFLLLLVALQAPLIAAVERQRRLERDEQEQEAEHEHDADHERRFADKYALEVVVLGDRAADERSRSWRARAQAVDRGRRRSRSTGGGGHGLDDREVVAAALHGQDAGDARVMGPRTVARGRGRGGGNDDLERSRRTLAERGLNLVCSRRASRRPRARP